MQKIRIIEDQRGFSLAELLIAITILAIGLLAAVSMQGVALNSNSFANRHSAATTIGEQIMNDLLSMDARIGTAGYTIFTSPGTRQYNRFPPYNGGNAPVTSYTVQGVGTFTANYTVTPNYPAQNISEIQLQIRIWLNGNPNPVPFTLYGHKLIPST